MNVRSLALAAAVVGLAALLYAACWGSFYVGFFNDDVVYIALARSLVNGTGYSDLEIAGAPTHFKFPPALPLMLAPLQAFWPDGLEALQALSVAFALAGVALLVAWLSDASPAVRWGSALLLACNPYLVRYASTVMSDVPFMTVTVLYLLLARPACNGTCSPRRAALLGVLAAFAFYLRSIGAALVPATGLAMAVHRQGWRPIAAHVTAFAAGIAPWVMRRGLLVYQGAVSDGFAQTPWYDIVGQNLAFYLPGLPLAVWSDPIRFMSRLIGTDASIVGRVLVALTWGLLAAGFARREGCRPSPAGFLFVLYCGAFVLWPYRDIRFFVPLLPLLVVYFTTGLEMTATRLVGADGGRVAIVLTSFLAVWLVGLDLHNATHMTAEDRKPPLVTYAWMRDNLPQGATVRARSGALWLYTGRPIEVLSDWSGTAEGAVRDIFKGTSDYVLLRTGDVPDASPPEMWETLGRRTTLFAPVHAEAGENAVVFRIIGDRTRFLGAYDAFVRGVQLANTDQPDAGRKALRECVALEPDFPPAEFNLALLTWQAGDLAEAERLLISLLRRHPDHAKAQALLQQVRAR